MGCRNDKCRFGVGEECEREAMRICLRTVLAIAKAKVRARAMSRTPNISVHGVDGDGDDETRAGARGRCHGKEGLARADARVDKYRGTRMEMRQDDTMRLGKCARSVEGVSLPVPVA